MEVGGVRPSSFHGSPGSACKVRLSGSLLAAGWQGAGVKVHCRLAQPQAASSSFQAPAQN